MQDYKLNFTILTPSFNRANTLHRVFESLKNQTIQGIFEWIIVDDGSSDDTYNLVTYFQKNADFHIKYIFQKNSGKISALLNGIKYIHGELLLIADSDDRFKPQTLEILSEIWKSFSIDERKKCSGIAMLCETQNGQNLGGEFPNEGWFDVYKSIFSGINSHTGETWSALNSEMILRHFNIPDEVLNLKFIPESFFWTRLAIVEKPRSYRINKRLRIYYINESNTGALSQNIRQKQPLGFLFESKYFLNNYPEIIFDFPKSYIIHVIKYSLFSRFLGYNFITSFNNLSKFRAKILFLLLYFPSQFIFARYFNK
ncbi:MAG: glycosyltransferase family A protein [Wolinella sp.]